MVHDPDVHHQGEGLERSPYSESKTRQESAEKELGRDEAVSDELLGRAQGLSEEAGAQASQLKST